MEDQTVASPPLKETCVSCGAKMKGNYCRKCGEKKIIPARDFRISKFLSQSLWHFVRFDSKLLKSCWLLYSKPGFLTAEWIKGRRVLYMKPLQLFVIASLLFYFFLPTVPAYYTTPQELIDGYRNGINRWNSFQFDYEELLAKKAAIKGLDEKVFADNISQKAAKQSKTWQFFIIPFWGSLIWLLFQKKLPWLAPHLIFAMHGLTFSLLTDLLIHGFLALFGFVPNGFYIFIVLMSLILIYQTLAVHRVYGNSWIVTILKTIVIVAGYITILLLYRQVITLAVTFSQ